MIKQYIFVEKQINGEKTPVLTLKNNDELDKWIISRAEILMNKNTYDKENVLELLNEINEMCNDELNGEKNVIFDTSIIDHNKGINLDKIKQDIIYSYNYIRILGNIIFLTFDLPGFRLDYIEESSPAPFSRSDIVKRAYNDILVYKYNHNRHISVLPAYGATLEFLTLIECELKLHIKYFYLQKYMKIIDEKLSNVSIALSQEDNDYICYLKSILFKAEEYKGNNRFDSTASQNDLFYMFLSKYNLIVDNDNEIKKLFCININDQFTLNQLKESNLFKEIIDNRFYITLNNLFGRSKLNIRNQIAHMKVEYFNYFNISNTLLLYFIFLIISQNWFLKDGLDLSIFK